jgi:hypothetical protein
MASFFNRGFDFIFSAKDMNNEMILFLKGRCFGAVQVCDATKAPQSYTAGYQSIDNLSILVS